jgi:hypothetical protein
MEKRMFLFALTIMITSLGSFTAHAQQSQGLQFDSDVSQKLRTQVLDDFAFMQGLSGTRESPLHNDIFGKIDGANYGHWFNQRVYYFGVDRCGGGSAVACVKPKYKNKIFVTNNYINISHPQIARLMTLYHEARHTEADHDNWPHAKCPSNFPYRSIWTGRRLNGNAACDSTAYGSYSSASILLNNVSKFCENCSDKVKADAKIYADDQVKRVIGKDAIAQIQQDFNF